MLTQALVSGLAIFGSLLALFLRLPARPLMLSLKFRGFVDFIAFLGTFVLFQAFSHSFVSLLTSAVVGLCVTGFLEFNHGTQLLEKNMLRKLEREILLYKKRERIASTKNEYISMIKLRHKREREAYKIRKLIEDRDLERL